MNLPPTIHPSFILIHQLTIHQLSTQHYPSSTIHPFIHLSIYLPFIHPSTHLFTFNPFTNNSVFTIHPSTTHSPHLSTNHPSIHPLNMHTCMHATIHPSTNHSSIYPQPCINPSTSIHSFNYIRTLLSTLLPVATIVHMRGSEVTL